jgi:tetratricopeptide (TPR) repeat protein
MTDFVEKFQELLDIYQTTYYGDEFIDGLNILITLAEKEKAEDWLTYFQGKLAQFKESYPEALEKYEKVIDRPFDTNDIVKRILSSWALFGKGVVLGHIGKHEEAIKIFDEAVNRYGKDNHLELQMLSAWSLLNIGQSLKYLNKLDEAIKIYDKIKKCYEDKNEIKLQRGVAVALVNKIKILTYQEKYEDAFDLLTTLITRFSDFDDEQINELLKDETILKGQLLEKRNEPEKALETYRTIDTVESYISRLRIYADHIVEEFKDDADIYLKNIESRKERTKEFLQVDGQFERGRDLFFVLREWNSYTPVVPDEQELNRGGGYFIWTGNQGIVIDPGFNFIENFHKAGGRVCDIHHIVITHAHGDHTADFESLLTLLYEYNDERNKEAKEQETVQPEPKKVNLFLNQGAARKFSGLYSLRGTPYLNEIKTLNRGSKEHPQIVDFPGLSHVQMTILRAYHDDIITKDNAVGLGFEFTFNKEKPDENRRILLTSDSSLFPENEKQIFKYDQKMGKQLEEKIDIREEKALYTQYPGGWDNPDLMIPHLGSILDFEIKPELEKIDKDASTPKFYENHLGLRGVLIMLDRLRPDAAVLSEFGEELKEIKFPLAEKLQKQLKKIQEDVNKEEKEIKEIPVIPGDITIVYDIKDAKFFCHETLDFENPLDIEVEPGEDVQSTCPYTTIKRTFLFKKDPSVDPAERKSKVSYFVKKYHLEFEEKKLEYFK